MTGTPDTSAVTKEVNEQLAKAQAFEVVNEATYVQAVSAQRICRLTRKKVEALFADPKRAQQHALDVLRASEKSLTEPLLQADRIFGVKADAYRTQQELARQAEKRRLEAEQREKAEKAAAIARAEAEERRKADEERRLAEAQKWADDGMPEVADEILSAPEPEQPPPLVQVMTPVILPEAVPDVAGVSYSNRWRAEVEDFRELLTAIKDGRIPIEVALEIVEPNMVELNRRARNLKSELAIPGVVAMDRKTPSMK